MNEIKQKLISQALEKYSDILPCATRTSLDECFTLEGSRVFFWFNTMDCTTHLIVSDK
jgi:hypothetical protein